MELKSWSEYGESHFQTTFFPFPGKKNSNEKLNKIESNYSYR